MKLNNTVKLLLASLGIITCISIIGINTIVKNNREEVSRLEKEKLEQKVNDLEKQLKDQEESTKNKESIKEEVKPEEVNEDEAVAQQQMSAMDMYNQAVNEHSHLAVNRFFNYYMAVYGEIENNYYNYPAKDMYEVADKFLNLLYGDIKDNGGLSDELLQEQRDWVDYKSNNFNENDYTELYRYTMNRCEYLISMYK